VSFDGLNSDIPRVGWGAFKTAYGGVQLYPGSRVVYVRGTNGSPLNRTGDDPFIHQAGLYPTLAEGLGKCRAGLGDTVIVLPGHTENVSTATQLSANLVADTRVIGFGRGSSMPTFTFTAVAATFALSAANVELSGLRFALTGADEITKGFAITSADGKITGCDFIVATGASNNAAIAIEFGLACDRFEFVGNRVRGSVAGPPTKVLSIAAVSTGLRIIGNKIGAAASAVGMGLIDISAAALDLEIGYNLIHHRLASSETGISAGAVAAEGQIYNNYIAVEAGTPVSDTIELNAASLLRCFDNKGTDTKNTSGLLTPAVVT
jgi:hypothetical protein